MTQKKAPEASEYIAAQCESFEIVERKGLGHPDTMADDLAEELSRVYSKYDLSVQRPI